MIPRNRAVAVVVALLVARVAFASAQGNAPPTIITGTLLGADGRPMKVAHVHLVPSLERAVLAEAAIAPDGRYAVATTWTGFLRLTFTGVDHQSASVPLILERPTPVVLDVQLARYRYADTLDKVIAIGDWNHFNFDTGRPMQKQTDGRYTLEVETTEDTVAYELLGLTESRSINGTDAIRYVYDGGGDYRSILKAEKGKATIVFDPRLLDRRPSEERIIFRDKGSLVARVADLDALVNRWSRAFFDSSRAASARKDSLHFDRAAPVRELTAQLAREREPLMRQMLLLALLQWAQRGAALDPATLARVTQEVPPTSLAWSSITYGEPVFMIFAYELAAHPHATFRDAWKDTVAVRQAMVYVDSVVAKHPNRIVRADALASAVQLGMAAGQTELANKYFLRLGEEYPDAPMLSFLKAQFAPDRVLRVGVPVPDFHFAMLTDTTKTFTRDAMRGKTYLLDFWATWCGPCIGDMPYLHAAYDSLHAKGLEILSVSLDRDPSDVTHFVADKWKMPWLHAFARGGFTNAAMKQFEVVFIPRMALVGADGKILAVDGDLRGDKLLPTLRQEFPTVP